MSTSKLYREVGKSLIGRNIKLLRDVRGFSQKELAELVGASTGTLSHIESGTRQPSLEMLYKIADALNVSVLNLLLDEKEIDRFFYDDIIQSYYPGSAKLKELLDQIIDNNLLWNGTKRVAIVDLDDLEKPKK